MHLFARALIGLSALSHFYFLYLEMFAWTRPLGMRVFRNSPEKAQTTAVLAANQGLHNGFLAAGLTWSLFHPEPAIGRQIAIFFLGCVVVAGVYGAISVSRRILFVQALPAAIAVLALFFGI